MPNLVKCIFPPGRLLTLPLWVAHTLVTKRRQNSDHGDINLTWQPPYGLGPHTGMAVLERHVACHKCALFMERRRKRFFFRGVESGLAANLWTRASGRSGHFRAPHCHSMEKPCNDITCIWYTHRKITAFSPNFFFILVEVHPGLSKLRWSVPNVVAWASLLPNEFVTFHTPFIGLGEAFRSKHRISSFVPVFFLMFKRVKSEVNNLLHRLPLVCCTFT